MAFVKADRVQETSETIGTGNIILGGAYEASYRTFAGALPGGAAMVNGDTCQVLIINTDASNEWEIVEATYVSSTNAIARTTRLSSSTGATVSFTSGTKRVAMLPPASASVVEDNAGNASIANNLTVGGDLTVTGDIVMDDISVDTATFRGSTSGSTTVNAAAVAGTTALTLPAATDTLVGKATTDVLTNKSISGSTNTLTLVPVTALNSGTSASSSTFWRGDGTWSTPPGTGVSTWSGGTTGLTPASATAGAVTLAGTLAVANGGTGVTAFGTVSSKTSGYSLLAADSYTDFDNNGAVGSVTFLLPTASVGLAYGFAVMEAFDLVIDAPGGVTIYYGEGLLTTAGGTLTASTVGSYIFIKCRSSTEWLAQSVIGGWNPT